MERMGPIPRTVLLQLYTLTIIQLVLGRYVVTSLAGFACQGDMHSLLCLCHNVSPLRCCPVAKSISSGGGTRTRDFTIMSRVLCQLSYAASE